ncbi:MAG: ThuA protein [Haloplasmataceae bacterium]|jgi:type 1 glutamine amidotransferase|nr:ThuA protein [Haloplasmataceae bacterium]
MKILLLCDDYYHHSDIVVKGLEYLNETYSVDIIEDAHEFNVDEMNQYRIIIFSKSNNYTQVDRTNWMTNKIELAFVEYVKYGGSLIILHSGTAGYKETPIFRELMGGVFINHPKQCEISVEPVKITPITQGIEPFIIMDEHYHMEINEKDIDVIMNTKSVHGVQPGGWIREVGKGKVFVFTPGHNLNVWQNVNFKKIVLNSIIYCLE